MTARLAFAIITFGVLARFRRRSAAPRRRQLHSSTASFGQADRNRLLRGTRAMFAFANVMDFLAHEFARLRRRRLSFRLVPACSSKRFFFWHRTPSLCFSAEHTRPRVF